MLKRNKIILIGLAILLVLVIGIFWYNKKKNNTVVIPKKIVTPAEIEKAKRVVELNNLNTVLDKARLTDKDLDGLTNEEEKKLGTDPLKSDTDGDGILDNDEIKLYKTDPLKADTDGDGKSDGWEVRRNLDPLKK